MVVLDPRNAPVNVSRKVAECDERVEASTVVVTNRLEGLGQAQREQGGFGMPGCKRCAETNERGILWHVCTLCNSHNRRRGRRMGINEKKNGGCSEVSILLLRSTKGSTIHRGRSGKSGATESVRLLSVSGSSAPGSGSVRLPRRLFLDTRDGDPDGRHVMVLDVLLHHVLTLMHFAMTGWCIGASVQQATW